MKRQLPAALMSAVSMALTLAVILLWLGDVMPWPVALVVGLGLDGGWLATLAYERRLARQGDRSTPVTVVGWGFGLVATGVLVAHAVTGPPEDMAGWLAVSWLPLAAKCLWLVHGLWEQTELTPRAVERIGVIRQTARDDAAVQRAMLAAQAGAEVTRLQAVSAAGASVAEVQQKAAKTLSGAWSKLEENDDQEQQQVALQRLGTGSWALPVRGPWQPVDAPPHGALPLLDDAEPVMPELEGGPAQWSWKPSDSGDGTDGAQQLSSRAKAARIRSAYQALGDGAAPGAVAERLAAEGDPIDIAYIRNVLSRTRAAEQRRPQVQARIEEER
ncbi:protein spdB [Streptomyces chilikensis]|uniref:Protein spdB n=1 Tax=Streptomyces chilikensis TaxID=1194079 RepID=A0ABV3EXW4_9ACTN